ncbi:MAG: TVP38/TMEM64 family protein [Planctomycetota bacterium]|jgi:uncharacterized membrane protein YdjX (TVP38/TMEM64 family)
MPEEGQGNKKSVKKTLLKKMLLAVFIAGIFVLSIYVDLGNQLERIQNWIKSIGPWGPAAFIIIYAALTVLAMPGSVLTLAAGAIFGLIEGTIYTFIAAMLGACGAFLTARYFARDWVKEKLSGGNKLGSIDSALETEGLKIMTLLRLSPVFPFNFLNFALGFTGVKFRDYVIAGFAMIPGTILYVYYGFVAGSVVKIAGKERPERGIEYYLFVAVGLVATIAVTAVITKMAKKALKKASGEDL